MKIKTMTATFGGLHETALTPGEGLTVITAPNEGGKSSWTAFVRAMLYGIDTKERDKGGCLADKNRYQPWSGAPMRGEMTVEWEGREITLRRSSTKVNPMQKFEAVYTASGDPVPGLTGANAGQTLLGAGKDVFVRSALVGQNAVAVTQNADLESRIASLATAGQEDVSHSATERVLKDWKNRRRLNRSNGLIPELERELARVEQILEEQTLARRRKAEAEERLAALDGEQKLLLDEREIHRRLAQKDLNRRYGEALLAKQEAEEQLNSLPAGHPCYEGLSADEARSKYGAGKEAAARREEQVKAQLRASVERYVLNQQRSRLKTWAKILVPLLGAAGLAMAVVGFLIPLTALLFGGIGCMVLGVAAAILLVWLMGGVDRRLADLPAEETIPEPEQLPDVEDYLRLLARKELLEQEIRHCAQRADDLKSQGATEFDTMELLWPPERSAAETAARLSAVERELDRWQSQLDRAIGALREDPAALEERKNVLLARVEERTAQYDALELALDGLSRANSLLRERFSPALNQKAAELFGKLTGGRYDRLTLSREFAALAGQTGGGEAHSAAYLSAGTVDQLYLATRLALCSLTLPDAPLLLDDALANFDDGRAELALDVLKELAAERQILLFTCHSREAAWAERNGIPVISL